MGRLGVAQPKTNVRKTLDTSRQRRPQRSRLKPASHPHLTEHVFVLRSTRANRGAAPPLSHEIDFLTADFLQCRVVKHGVLLELLRDPFILEVTSYTFNTVAILLE